MKNIVKTGIIIEGKLITGEKVDFHIDTLMECLNLIIQEIREMRETVKEFKDLLDKVR